MIRLVAASPSRTGILMSISTTSARVSRASRTEVFELHAAGKTEVVYERRQLEDVNSAIYEVETGQVKARLVFDLR
jgi:propanol-preferring alcohol dehydrogenase